MKWRSKEHPMREVSVFSIRLIGHDRVEIGIDYNTTTDKYDTNHIHKYRISLCDARYLGHGLQGIAEQLQSKLNEFKRAISGP